jgi:preprotein translocase subunit SecD
MKRKSYWQISVVLVVLVLALLVVFPIHRGILGHKDVVLGLDLQGGLYLVYEADLENIEDKNVDDVLSGITSVIQNRVNPLGLTEASIEQQGENRIAVQLPGATLTQDQIDAIGRTALLEFREQSTDADGKLIWIPATGELNGETVVLSSNYFKDNTYVAMDDTTKAIYLVFNFTEEGAKLSEQVTTRLLHKQLGIFEGDQMLMDATVQAVITTSGQITGLSSAEATILSKQLNAGRLPVALDMVYQETVTPTLGADFVRLAVIAAVIGTILVMLLMSLYYKVPGIVSSVALLIYAVILLAVFKLFNVTLSLAAIGGFVVSIGMAVDANVLIFERLKEELANKRTLNAACEVGFSRAWSAIWDSNITTIIACIILAVMGSSIPGGASVQGFAITLLIGVIVSLFTATFVTRSLLRLVVATPLSNNPGLFTPARRRKDA